jgi:hypothetical protein
VKEGPRPRIAALRNQKKIQGLRKKKAKKPPSLSWLNQMKTIKEDDNPILVLVRLKK